MLPPEHEPQEDFDPQWCPRLPDKRVPSERDETRVQHFVGGSGTIVVVRRPTPHDLAWLLIKTDTVRGFLEI